VGDVIPGTDYRTYRLPQDWQYLFGGIQHQLQQADVVFGNFESTLTEVRNSPKGAGGPNVFAFRTPPWYASVLKVAGFDVMSVANNHSFDFGDQGFADTMANLEKEGIKAVGRKGEIVYTEAKGLKLAFIAFSHLNQHNTVHDLDAAAALVQEAEQNADIVVVSFHAGKEGSDATVTRNQTEYFLSENRGNVVQFSRTVVDHGADLVLGHGPHVPRALELYNNKLIAYSLGNFLGYRTLSTAGPLGTSLILTTNLDGNGDFVSGRVVPVALDRNGVPYLDDHFKGVILVRTATRRDFPDTPLTIDDEGYIWRSP
jgi:poly-gamma-glutamate capsule biosynthesis protein CapA/YwtB (metallophosphatase superfamily)